jgi:hypothetical protein
MPLLRHATKKSTRVELQSYKPRYLRDKRNRVHTHLNPQATSCCMYTNKLRQIVTCILSTPTRQAVCVA